MVWALAIPTQFTVTSFPETLVVAAAPAQVAPVNVAAWANWKTTWWSLPDAPLPRRHSTPAGPLIGSANIVGAAVHFA